MFLQEGLISQHEAHINSPNHRGPGHYKKPIASLKTVRKGESGAPASAHHRCALSFIPWLLDISLNVIFSETWSLTKPFSTVNYSIWDIKSNAYKNTDFILISVEKKKNQFPHQYHS